METIVKVTHYVEIVPRTMRLKNLRAKCALKWEVVSRNSNGMILARGKRHQTVKVNKRNHNSTNFGQDPEIWLTTEEFTPLRSE